MALFKKRSGDRNEIARLRSEIEAMSARLDAVNTTEARLGGQLGELSTRVMEVAAEASTTRPVSRADHDELNTRVLRLSEQLDAAIEAGEEASADGAAVPHDQLDELRERLEAISERLDTPLAAPPPPPPDTAVDAVDAVDDRVDLGRVEERIDELAARLDEVDARITSISTELANQLTEISDDLDGRDPDSPAADAVVAELRDAQVRLAGEQARYQIAFRQDLADLAERLKRG